RSSRDRAGPRAPAASVRDLDGAKNSPSGCCGLVRSRACDGVRGRDGGVGIGEGAYMAVIVAMHHDQGLVPLKALWFGKTVNWTLGLAFVRTSVDHGTV